MVSAHIRALHLGAELHTTRKKEDNLFDYLTKFIPVC
jgi:hypothetical protein